MKLVIGAGVGLLIYELYQHFQASGQITTLAATTTPVPAYSPVSATTSPVAIPGPGGGSSLAVAAAPITAATPPNNTQLQDLLTWSKETQNPTLYAAMINALSAADLNSLYGILVNQWDTGAKPTVAETQFWNYLRGLYPFLNTAGVGCTNFTCT